VVVTLELCIQTKKKTARLRTASHRSEIL